MMEGSEDPKIGLIGISRFVLVCYNLYNITVVNIIHQL